MKKEEKQGRGGIPLVARLVLCLGLFGVALEFMVRAGTSPSPLMRLAQRALWPVLSRYARVRESLLSFVSAHPVLAVAGTVLGLTGVLLACRALLLFWHNNVKARFSGTRFKEQPLEFPMRAFDVLLEIGRRPKGTTFVGLSPSAGLLGWRWRAVYISARQRSMHRHVVGKTGSGKTLSVLWPEVLQDALDGKGVLVMDAKGSDENIRVMKGIAAIAGRQGDLKVFSLPAWNRPQLFSHTYNMVYVRPRRRTSTGTDPGGDPVAVAERVFSILSLGDNEYYNTQAQNIFVNLCRLMHGMVDADGNGLVFTMRDIAVALKGIRGPKAFRDALYHCLRHSLDLEAQREILSQIGRLGEDVHKCF